MNIVTLLTDFGTRDYFVGAMKGAVLSVNPAAQIIDITHETPPHDIRAAAFTLFAAHSTFPVGTVHIAVVDPGVGSARRAIIAATQNNYFVAPDNGLLTLIYENEPDARVFEVTNDRFFRQPVSRTFHGRDVFAPIGAALSSGVTPAELGTEIIDFARFTINKPFLADDQTLLGEILQIDRFGNCITNLKRADLPFDKFTVEINERKIIKHQQFFAEAAVGELFTIFGSADLLEIVAFQASAANSLNAAVGEVVKLRSS